MIGIYCIENIVNSKKYIGKTINISKRFSNHKYELGSNNHPNQHLQGAFNKYGKENFMFFILEECGKEILDSREKYWISSLNTLSSKEGYNFSNGGGGIPGYRFSSESKKKMSISQSNRSDETKKRISESKKGSNHPLFGKSLSSEHKEKIRKANSGEKNCLFGKNLSEETKKKISLSLSGKNHRNFGKHLSESTRSKIANSQPRKRLKSSSVYMGVSLIKSLNKWKSYIRIEKKLISLGNFFNEIDAAKAYDNYIINNNIARELNFFRKDG